MAKKPEVSVDILRKAFPDFPVWIQTERGLESPLGQWFVDAFVSLPDENGGEPEKQLKPSRFDMSEYVVQ